jgi:dihydrodipicolinate synthase/N-acetylneuraminate lyase
VAPLDGLFPVMPTPLRGGSIDREGAERLTDWVGPHVAGMTVLGSSGESGYLSPAQRREALAAFAEAAARHRLHLIVGVTDPATSGAVEFVRSDEAAGASAFLVLPPTYYPSTLDASERHLRAIADAASGRPLIFYDIPGLSGLSLGAADVRELMLRIPAIGGVKFSRLDLAGIGDLATDESLSLFAGYDEIAHEQVAEGCRGVMAPFVAMCPEQSRRWYDALAGGDRQAAFTVFLEEISPLIRAMVGSDVDFIAVVKRFLHRLGVIASAELAPGLAELSEARSRQVDEHFEYVIARQTADVPR